MYYSVIYFIFYIFFNSLYERINELWAKLVPALWDNRRQSLKISIFTTLQRIGKEVSCCRFWFHVEDIHRTIIPFSFLRPWHCWFCEPVVSCIPVGQTSIKDAADHKTTIFWQVTLCLDSKSPFGAFICLILPDLCTLIFCGKWYSYIASVTLASFNRFESISKTNKIFIN